MKWCTDNNLKHVSKLAQEFVQANNINWWRIPQSRQILTLLSVFGMSSKSL